MLSTKQKIKEMMLLIVFNVLLPSLDVYSDIALIVKFISSDHYNWAGLLIVPFTLNYLLTWGVWWRLDKMKKKYWIAVALACYPQFRAVKVILSIWRNSSEKALEKKRTLEREVSEYEVFAESAITAVVMTYLMMTGVGSREFHDLIIGKDYSVDLILFFTAYATSIISTSLGLAKCLKVGPCHVLAEKGAVGGLLTVRFLTLMISIGVTLSSKGSLLSILSRPDSTGKLLYPALSMMFLPGLILALMSLFHNKDWIKIIKSIISYPSLILFPVFTHYTFSANGKSFCCRKEEGGQDDIRTREDIYQIPITISLAESSSDTAQEFNSYQLS
jgi:hypothetical protein